MKQCIISRRKVFKIIAVYNNLFKKNKLKKKKHKMYVSNNINFLLRKYLYGS